MKLNHLNLTVTDPEATASFLTTYFGLEHQGGNRGMVLLRDENGMVLTLMKAKTVVYPDTFHIGFIQPSEAKVDEIYARLTADGFTPGPPQRSHGWTFYVQAPGGFTVEVLA
ncbi:MAG: hypothetical protein JWR75_706 [Devosia sp.]|nr:hypothetical protein [Devosia sp.]